MRLTRGSATMWRACSAPDLSAGELVAEYVDDAGTTHPLGLVVASGHLLCRMTTDDTLAVAEGSEWSVSQRQPSGIVELARDTIHSV